MASLTCEFIHDNCSTVGLYRTDTSITACAEFVQQNPTGYDYRAKEIQEYLTPYGVWGLNILQIGAKNMCEECYKLLRKQGIACDKCIQDFLYNNPTDDDYLGNLTP